MYRNTKNDLLPSSANKYERALSLATKFAEDVIPEDIKKLWRPDEIPSKFLPFLAWGMHVDFWCDDLPEEVKRTLIKSSFEWHRLKGTKWAVERALRDIGVEPIVIPWFEIPEGKPYTFAVRAKVLDDYYTKNERWNEMMSLIRSTIDVSKSARDGLVKLTAYLEDSASYNLYHGVADLRGGVHKVLLPRPEYEKSEIFHGVATGKLGKMRVNPARPSLEPLPLYSGIATGQGKIITIGPAPGEFNPRNPLVHIHGYTLGAGVGTGTGIRYFVGPSRPEPRAEMSCGIATGQAYFLKLFPAE